MFWHGDIEPQADPGLPPPVQGAARPEHKGVFGVKGTLRNILGVLGDAFLVQSGNKPVYQQRRALEKEGDAMEGFVDNPLAAIQRLAGENPEASREMWGDYQNAERYKNQEERLSQTDQRKGTDMYLTRAANIMAGAKDDKDKAYRRGVVENYLKKNGIEPPVDIDLLADYDYKMSQREDDERGERGLDVKVDQFGRRIDYYDRRDERRDRTQRYGIQTRAGVAREGNAVRREGIKSREGIAGRQIKSREHIAGMAPAVITKNKKDETTVYTRGGKVTTLRDSVHPSGGKSRRTPPGAAGGGKKEGFKYREAGTGRVYTWTQGRKVYN